MKKVVITIVLAAVILSAVMIPVSAASANNGIQPLWDYTMSVDASMNFRNGIGTAFSAVVADFSATAITTDIYVYRQSGDDWVYVDENHETVYDFLSGTTCEFDIIWEATYKADYTFTIHMGNQSETIYRTIYGTYNSVEG